MNIISRPIRQSSAKIATAEITIDSRVIANWLMPLSKKLHDQAMPVYEELSKHFMIDYDEAGSIGKRYRREDEIGTPLCITVDFETETDGCVTIRDRDTMEQIRLPIAEVKDYIAKKCEF